MLSRTDLLLPSSAVLSTSCLAAIESSFQNCTTVSSVAGIQVSVQSHNVDSAPSKHHTPALSAAPAEFCTKAMLHRTPVQSRPSSDGDTAFTHAATTPVSSGTPMFGAHQVTNTRQGSISFAMRSSPNLDKPVAQSTFVCTCRMCPTAARQHRPPLGCLSFCWTEDTWACRPRR